jgi:hypothetical protein
VYDLEMTEPICTRCQRRSWLVAPKEKQDTACPAQRAEVRMGRMVASEHRSIASLALTMPESYPNKNDPIALGRSATLRRRPETETETVTDPSVG